MRLEENERAELIKYRLDEAKESIEFEMIIDR